jgi:hypothetical protein
LGLVLKYYRSYREAVTEVALFGKNVHRAADIRSAETRPSEFGDREGLVSVSFLITQARSTDDEYATRSRIAITPATAIPSATIILIVHCMILLRMASPHPSGAALAVPMQLR